MKISVWVSLMQQVLCLFSCSSLPLHVLSRMLARHRCPGIQVVIT